MSKIDEARVVFRKEYPNAEILSLTENTDGTIIVSFKSGSLKKIVGIVDGKIEWAQG